MAGKSASTSSPRINQLAVQTSALGLALTRGWGRGRAKCNLIWFGAFRSIPHTEKSGGKGGGVKNTTYSYTASVILSIGEGPIAGVRSVYRDKDIFTDGATTALAQAGLSLATGEVGQPVWPYLTSMFQDQALAYSGTAYVYAQDYDLTDSASLQNHSFEVDFASHIEGLPDADPSVVVRQTIEGTPGWPAQMVGDLTVYGDYCLANNLVLSPVLEQQQTVSDFLAEILQATNSEAVWSEGQVKVRTYGDATATANGRTFTPDLTPVYDLTEDDFVPQGGEDGPPVVQEIVDQTDAYNIVQVEHLDRANQYNTAIQTAQDLDNIIQYGARKKDPVSLHAICETEIGQHAAQLILQRTLYRRERFKFQLPWNFVLLEPMDYVTLTTTTDQLRLSRRLVQIKEIDEDEDGLLTFTAEGVEVGTASAALYSSGTGDGYAVNTSIAPPPVSSPVLINAPLSLTAGVPQVWVAASSPLPHWGGCEVWASADGTNYKRVGVIQDPARYGSLVGSLPAHADPDPDASISVDISASGGKMETASQQDVDTGVTLCWLGGELVAYRDATLTGPSAYDLSYLRRGLYGSAIVDHVEDEDFVRLDEAIFKYGYGDLSIGTEIHVKLPSFNEFGLATQSLADVPAYTLSLQPLPGRVLGLQTVDTGDSGDIGLTWDPLAGATSYTAYFYSADGETFKRAIDTTAPVVTYFKADQDQDGALPGYLIYVVAQNNAGSGPPTSISVGQGGPTDGNQPTATNGSFELPDLGGPGIIGNPTAPNVVFGGYSGIASNGSAMNFANAPDGDQVAYLASLADGGAEVTIGLGNLVVGASYTISLMHARRNGVTPTTVTASVGGTSLGTFLPVADAWAEKVLSAFTATATTATLVLSCGPSSTGDQFTGVDRVLISKTGSSSQPAALTGVYAEGAGYNRLSVGANGATGGASGYAIYLSTTSGFTPTGAPTRTSSTPTSTFSIGSGNWYVRIAAYNSGWDGSPASLNFSEEVSAFVEDYRENCLDPATPVMVEDGDVALGTLRVGDRVRTQHPETGRWGLYTVLAAVTTMAEERLRLTLEDGRVLVGTPRHRFRTAAGGWSRLQDLVPGAALAGSTPGVVASLEDAGRGPVVRLSVSGAQTYVSAGILSHNIKATHEQLQ